MEMKVHSHVPAYSLRLIIWHSSLNVLVTLLEKAAELQIPRKALECLEIPGCSRNPELCEVLLELLIILFTKGTVHVEIAQTSMVGVAMGTNT